ncbi:IS630 family transposase [Streptomyces hirsutus]|uniref:IS630 family transposase n=1 Tax=Streptomyces hirsutus TaxID=35620 RepID=UPI003B970478
MRYAQGGGLTAGRRQSRERIRLQTAERFARGEKTSVIAADLRVSERSVERRRRTWREDGPQGLASKGSAGRPRLTDAQFAVLEEELAKGPAAHGWPDQRWTLERIKTVIGRRFHLTCSVTGVWRLLHCHGWSWQAPARHALERNQAAVELWKKDVAARGSTAAALGAWLVFEDEAGFSMTPPCARTWGRRGRTPLIQVRGRSWRRLSIAAMACYQPGERARLIWRPKDYRRFKHERKSFAWTDYRDLAVCAHLQLGGPIVLLWDNLNTHLAAGMRRFEAEHDWLTVYQLPAYAPDLNPVEGLWSLLRRGPLANTAFADADHLVRTVRRGLRQIQYRPALIDGCLTGTGLTISDRHPTPSRKAQ